MSHTSDAADGHPPNPSMEPVVVGSERSHRSRRNRQNLTLPKSGASPNARLAPVDFAQIVENEGVASAIFDGEFRFLYVNSAAELMMRHTRAELLGRSLWEIWPQIVDTYLADRFHEAMRSRQIVVARYRSLTGPGYYETRLVPYGADGLAAHYRDITAEQHAEQALRDSKDRLELALTAGRLGMWDWDLRTGQETWSTGQYHLYGFPPGSEIPSFETFLSRVHPEDRELLLQNAARIQDLGDGDYESEFRVLLPNGDLRWHHSRGRAYADPATGTPLRMIGITHDITDRKRAVDLLRADAARQRRIAEMLQRSLLMTTDTASLRNVEVAPVYASAVEDTLVGGDFFDAYTLPGNRTALIVGDVTGKGLDAAAVTAEVKYALRTLLREHGGDPNVALARLNQVLLDGQQLDGRSTSILVCVCVAVLEPELRLARFAVAGMDPPLLLRTGASDAELMPVGGLILGATQDPWFADPPTPPEGFAFGPGDLLLLYTDGLTEARPPQSRDFFGVEGVATAAATAVRSGIPLSNIGDAILAAAQAHAGSLRDDVCLLAARLTDGVKF